MVDDDNEEHNVQEAVLDDDNDVDSEQGAVVDEDNIETDLESTIHDEEYVDLTDLDIDVVEGRLPDNRYVYACVMDMQVCFSIIIHYHKIPKR